MSTIFVTGANRGIGLGLVKEFLKQADVCILIATTRNKQASKDLLAIDDARLHVVEMDVNDDNSITAAVKQASAIVGSDGIELLVNNSGIYSPYLVDATPDRAAALRHLECNAIGPLIVTQNFLPLLRQASKSSGHARIVIISSLFGSLSCNTGSTPKQAIAYKMSKAAVNQMMRTLSFDLADENIYCYAFCPGWVQTDMGGMDATLTVEESTSSLIQSFKKLGKEQNGGYFKKDLEVITF